MFGQDFGRAEARQIHTDDVKIGQTLDKFVPNRTVFAQAVQQNERLALALNRKSDLAPAKIDELHFLKIKN